MSKSQIIKHVLVISLGFLFLGYWFNINVFYVISVVVLFSLLNLKVALFIVNLWLKIGRFFGTINGFLWLSILYFFMLMPLSIIKKFFKKSNRNSLNTNWKDALPLTDFKRPF